MQEITDLHYHQHCRLEYRNAQKGKRSFSYRWCKKHDVEICDHCPWEVGWHYGTNTYSLASYPSTAYGSLLARIIKLNHRLELTITERNILRRRMIAKFYNKGATVEE